MHSYSYLKSLDASNKSTNKGLGNGLTLFIEPISKGGMKSYYGNWSDYSSGKRQQKRICLGKFNEISLSDVREKWKEIKSWSKKEYKTPDKYFQIKKIEIDCQKTVRDAVNGFLEYIKDDIKPTTYREYNRKLNNQILDHIDGDILLKDLEWDKGGRNLVMKAIKKIEENDKFDLGHRCRSLLKRTFDYAIHMGWMEQEQNPAKVLSCERLKRSQKHHHTIKWDEVPELLRAINLNKINANQQAILSTKLMLMTFLRVGALTRLEWDWIDEEKKLLTINGKTSGLKRNKGVNDDIPHLVPVTKEMESIFDRAKELNGHSKYVFTPIKENRYEHLDPETPNNYLKRLGYRKKLVAHGWRSVALTTGIDELKFSREVIKRQMGHLPEGKVNKAYDKSQMLPERRDFLEKWCGLLVENGLCLP